MPMLNPMQAYGREQATMPDIQDIANAVHDLMGYHGFRLLHQSIEDGFFGTYTHGDIHLGHIAVIPVVISANEIATDSDLLALASVRVENAVRAYQHLVQSIHSGSA